MPQGIVTRKSKYSVEETVTKLQAALEQKGIKIFALVDHSGEAASVGFKMPPTKLLIFGNPKAGTPIMLAAPSAAIDLPLKILIAEDAAGEVWLTWNDAEYLQQRHDLPREFVANLAAAGVLASTLT